jgi:hypothetical protein
MQKNQNDEVVSTTVPLTKATWTKPEIESLDLGATNGKLFSPVESFGSGPS